MSKLYDALFYMACLTVALIAVFFCGYYYGGKSVEPGVITREKIVTKTIYRDYPGMGRGECIDKLMCYDLKTPTLDIMQLDDNKYMLSAGLCEREWKREVSIEVARSGSWRFYVAGGLAAGVIATYILMK